MTPSKAIAGEVCDALMREFTWMRRELKGNDPDGRAMARGAAMFLGAVLADLEDKGVRQMVLDTMEHVMGSSATRNNSSSVST